MAITEQERAEHIAKYQGIWDKLTPAQQADVRRRAEAALKSDPDMKKLRVWDRAAGCVESDRTGTVTDLPGSMRRGDYRLSLAEAVCLLKNVATGDVAKVVANG